MKNLKLDEIESKNKYVPRRVFIDLIKNYIESMENNDIAIMAIFDESKNFQYLMSTQSALEDYFLKVFDKQIDEYYRKDPLRKKIVKRATDEGIEVFFSKLDTLPNLSVTKESLYSDVQMFVEEIDNEKYNFLNIEEDEKSAEIKIYSFPIILDFLEEIREKIRPERITKHLTKKEKILLHIAPSLVLFNGISEMDLLHVVKKIEFLKFKDGEKIYDHRDRVKSVDYILQGEVDFYNYMKVPIFSLKAKNVFGEKFFDTAHVFRQTAVFAKGDVMLLSMTFDIQKRDKFWKIYLKLYENILQSVGQKLSVIMDIDIKAKES
jgi:hypothetical protein